MTTHYDVIKLSGVQATWLVVKFNPGKKSSQALEYIMWITVMQNRQAQMEALFS